MGTLNPRLHVVRINKSHCNLHQVLRRTEGWVCTKGKGRPWVSVAGNPVQPCREEMEIRSRCSGQEEDHIMSLCFTFPGSPRSQDTTRQMRLEEHVKPTFTTVIQNENMAPSLTLL